MKKARFISCLLMAATATSICAQGGTKSPYSQYGLGVLENPSQGMSRGMNGVGLALRSGSQVNALNPASYSSVDSLTMLFDMGMSSQLTNYKEGGVSRNASQANFDYVVGSFRAWKNVGITFGILPYSNVGYEYKTSTKDSKTGTLTENFQGSGGLNQLFIGAGWRVMKPLSVGFNASYLWGNINRTVTPSSSIAANMLTKSYSTTVNNYKLDFGVQWEQPVGKNDNLTVGAVVGIGHNLSNDADMSIISKNSISNISDTTLFCLSNAMSLPMSFGVGASYCLGRKLTVAADFTFEKWGAIEFPVYANQQYVLQKGLLKDRTRIAAGVDWLPKAEWQGSKFLERVHYRFGVGYVTPYYNINGHDGPKEFSISAGFGIPIINMHNNRSVLNISGQWVQNTAESFITENTFRINIGLTFNERWFMKFKVD